MNITRLSVYDNGSIARKSMAWEHEESFAEFKGKIFAIIAASIKKRMAQKEFIGWWDVFVDVKSGLESYKGCEERIQELDIGRLVKDTPGFPDIMLYNLGTQKERNEKEEK